MTIFVQDRLDSVSPCQYDLTMLIEPVRSGHSVCVLQDTSHSHSGAPVVKQFLLISIDCFARDTEKSTHCEWGSVDDSN